MSRQIHAYLRQNVLGLVAIFIALGGVSWAASSLPRNSVTSVQIRNGAVKGSDLAPNSVGGSKVPDGSLGGADIDEASLSLPPTTPGGAAGGDLTGAYPSPQIAANSVGGAEVANDSLAGADVLESGLDFTTLQARVSGTCSAGAAIGSIGTLGDVSCRSFPTTLPPSGSAGGDLLGTYPNPSIAGNAVDGGNILDTPRSVSLPLGAFLNCDQANAGLIDFASGNDTAPDFETPADNRLSLLWDTGAAPDTDRVCTSVVIPQDMVQSPAPTIRLTGIAGAGGDNDWGTSVLRQFPGILSVPGGAEDTTAATQVNQNCDSGLTAGTAYTCSFTPVETLAPGDALIIGVSRTGGSNAMRLYGVEFRYTAAQ